jgi:hypothetical protein
VRGFRFFQNSNFIGKFEFYYLQPVTSIFLEMTGSVCFFFEKIFSST